MPRKKITKKKEVLVDPMYNSSILAKLITKVMYSGKKNLAQQIVYGAMDTIQEKMKEDPLKVITKAIENVRPQVETRSRRVGGATYQVPMEVRKERSYSLGIRWLVLTTPASAAAAPSARSWSARSWTPTARRAGP